jgi:hypothetical protein
MTRRMWRQLALTVLATLLGLLSLAGGRGWDWSRSVASLRLQLKPLTSVAFVTSSPAIHRIPRADLRPDWVRGSGWVAHQIQENASTLSQRRLKALDEGDSDSIWSLSALKRSRTVAPNSSQGRLQNQVRERLDHLQQEVEIREKHGLLDQQTRMNWADQNRALGRTFLRSLVSLQIRDSLQKAEKRSPEVRAVSKVQQKLDFLATTGVAVRVDEDWSFGSKADLPRQTGRLWMSSPFLNGSVDFRVGAQDTGLNEPGVAAPEAVQVSVGKDLPWDLQSGMTYGGSSRTMTAHVSRPLAPHLTCSVENRQRLAPGFADSRSEQTARINYQVVF